jgi:hypothetical protein
VNRDPDGSGGGVGWSGVCRRRHHQPPPEEPPSRLRIAQANIREIATRNASITTSTTPVSRGDETEPVRGTTIPAAALSGVSSSITTWIPSTSFGSFFTRSEMS